MSNDTKEMLFVEAIKNFDRSFRWEQDYYHHNARDAGRPVSSKRFNRFVGDEKRYYTEDEQKAEVRKYAEELADRIKAMERQS